MANTGSCSVRRRPCVGGGAEAAGSGRGCQCDWQGAWGGLCYQSYPYRFYQFGPDNSVVGPVSFVSMSYDPRVRIGRGRGIERTFWCDVCGRSCEKSLETFLLLRRRACNFTGTLRCHCTGDAGTSHRWAKRYQHDWPGVLVALGAAFRERVDGVRPFH